MNGKKAFRKFCERLANAPIGAPFTVGVTWDPKRGWCIFERIGEAVLILPTAQARGIVQTARRQSRLPPFQKGWQEIGHMFEELEKLCDECDEKNRTAIVPDPMLAAWLPRGTA